MVTVLVPVNKPVLESTVTGSLHVDQMSEKGKSKNGCWFCSMGGSWVEGQARQNNRPLHHNSISTDIPPTITTTVNNIISPTLRGDSQGHPSLVYAFQLVGVTRRVKWGGGVGCENLDSLRLGFHSRRNRSFLIFSFEVWV